MPGAAADRAERPMSFAAPFRHSAFTVIWTATLVSNVASIMRIVPALGAASALAAAA
jgi:hypothetical protein